MSTRTIIIVAGGKGSRMGSDTPKQFMKVDGKPILIHTIQRFFQFDSEIRVILVLPEAHVHIWEELAQEYRIEHPVDVVIGGDTRYESVQNGMKEASRSGVIGVHDGVRPLVSMETLERCFEGAVNVGNAIPSLPVEETLRHLSIDDSNWVERKQYRTIQTPQCFNAEIIQDAYNQPYKDSFTDDASVVESIGIKINLVEGNRENIKITRKEDLDIAELLIRAGK